MLTGLRLVVLGGLQRGLSATGLWRTEVLRLPTGSATALVLLTGAGGA